MIVAETVRPDSPRGLIGLSALFSRSCLFFICGTDYLENEEQMQDSPLTQVKPGGGGDARGLKCFEECAGFGTCVFGQSHRFPT
jgi:hypothetical protein